MDKDNNKDKKILISTYKYMFLISTVSGIIGTYLLYKQVIVIGWILVSVWAVFATFVRVMIIKRKNR
jgi:hypothetical protein